MIAEGRQALREEKRKKMRRASSTADLKTPRRKESVRLGPAILRGRPACGRQADKYFVFVKKVGISNTFFYHSS